MNTDTHPLYSKLCSYGIHDHSARTLLAQKPAEFIESKIDVLEYLLSERPGNISSPAGYLYLSIERDYAPPENYKTRTERELERTRRIEIEKQRKEAARQERVRDAAIFKKKATQQREFEIAGALAAQMDTYTENQLKTFINAQRPDFTRPCDNYDLRAPVIKSKPRDYASGTFFSFLRVEFFKQLRPEAFC
ncbi:MAG: hypothetical protein ACPGN3_11805 [Opitutales bacterium]